MPFNTGKIKVEEEKVKQFKKNAVTSGKCKTTVSGTPLVSRSVHHTRSVLHQQKFVIWNTVAVII